MPPPQASTSTTTDLARLGEDELVGLFVAARGSPDREVRKSGAAAWRVLIGREYDRVGGYVATFRFPDQPDVRVEAADRDEATHAALERCLDALSRSFRGASIGEFRAAVRTATRFACMDFCRARMRREQHEAGSIDDVVPSGEEDGAGRFDRQLGEEALALEEGRFDAAHELTDTARALSELPNEDMQAVIRLTIEGYSSKETAERLGLSPTNADQLRSRGLKQLRMLLSPHD